MEEDERCNDVWLREVQAEIRRGGLSKNNYAFLHGDATTVPGSWEGNDVKCKRASYVKPSELTRSIQQFECEVCTEEKKTMYIK